MARAASRRRSAARADDSVTRRVVEECVGVGLIGVALLLTLALGSFSPADPIFEQAPVANRAGIFGASAAALLLGVLGCGAFVVVAALAVLGVRLLLGMGPPRLASRFWVGAVLLLIAVGTFPPLLQSSFPGLLAGLPGGALGNVLSDAQRLLLGSTGALLLNAVLVTIGVLSATGVSTGAALRGVGVGLGWLAGGLLAAFAGLVDGTRAAGQGLLSGTLELFAGVQRGVSALGVWREQRRRRVRVAVARGSVDLEPLEESDEEGEVEAVPAARRLRSGDPTIVDHAADRDPARPARQSNFEFAEPCSSGPYQLPDISIFRCSSEGARSYDRDSLIMNSRILEKKLKDFGVGGRVNTVHPGPVITMYEFEPASGIKVNRIVSLADDLALALRALSVRIIAPLPGKSVVGIEVANEDREVVNLRDILEAEEYRANASKLSIALGKDIFGNPTYAELAKMPHLLVAGATGTGKSVFLNALLCSMLCRATPDELKLLLIDPKLLELSVYEGIPHLIADVVTNPKRAAAALAGVVRKMEERYQMMAALGVRSIDQYNTRVDKELEEGNKTLRLKPKAGEEEGALVDLQRFPYIVVVIDELADLMVVSARDVEESLQRLAQMARAAGIHLVLATQRPSVDVLTGVIKANFPARISFQVSSRTDSRTILDQNGAEHLLGQGDMLFLPPGTSKLQRIHGAYVSEEEVAELAQALRKEGSPNFDDTLAKLSEELEAKEAREDDDVDEMYDRAVSIVADSRNASISYLQRRLKVGYNRAARMIEQMENEGIIGPQEGTRPRDVFIRAIEA